jgi:hypothetical protein
MLIDVHRVSVALCVQRGLFQLLIQQLCVKEDMQGS